MNDVVNVLVEHGEVDPDAEVTIVVLVDCCYFYCVCCRVPVRLS